MAKNSSLLNKISRYNLDCEKRNKCKPKFFVCPILLKDDNSKIVKGHIINQALGKVSRKWVPQRGDVESFYGRVESVLTSSINVEKETIEKIIYNKNSSYGPKLFLSEKELDYYVPNLKNDIPQQFTPVFLPTKDRIVIKQKLDPNILEHGVRVELSGLPKNLADPIFYPVFMKMGYLTLFSLFGYDYVFTAAGHYVNSLLSEFFLDCDKMSITEFKRYAAEKYSSIRFWGTCVYLGGELNRLSYFDNKKLVSCNKNDFAGMYKENTVDSNYFLVHHRQDGKIFAVSIIIVLHDSNDNLRFLVTLPMSEGDPDSIALYDRFIKDPPKYSIVSYCKYVPYGNEEHKEPHVAISNNKIRINYNGLSVCL